MDPTTQAVIWLIEQNGYRVTVTNADIRAPGASRVTYLTDIEQNGDRVTAPHGQIMAVKDGQTHILRGPDTYALACQLAQQLTIDLADG